MKKLEGMKLNGKNIVVKSEDDFSATNIGEYGQMIFLHLTEELPDKLKEMKKAGTLVPFLKDMDNKIFEKVTEVFMAQQTQWAKASKTPGFIERSQILTQLKLETEKVIFNDLFPISPLDLPLVKESKDNDNQMTADQELQADIIGGIPYSEAKEMGFLEN